MKSNDSNTRLSRLEGVVEAIGDKFKSYIESQEKRDALLFKKLDEAKDLSRPNMLNMATWAGVIMLVIFGVWTPIANGFSERISNVAVTESTQAQLLIKNQDDKTSSVLEQVKRLQTWQDDQDRGDRQELRDWRLGRVKH